MKRSDLIFAALLIPVDFCMLVLAGLAAYFLRFTTLAAIRPVIFEIPFSRYIGLTCAVALFFIIIFACSGLYKIGYRKTSNEIQKIFTACSTAFMLVIVYIFFVQELFTSRFIILAAWIFSFLCVSAGRGLLRIVRSFIFSHHIGLHPILVIGAHARADEFIKNVEHHPNLGYSVGAYLENFEDIQKAIHAETITQNAINEIFVVDPTLPRETLQSIIDFATIQHIAVRYAADLIASKRLELSVIAGVPLIEIKRTKLEGWGRITKRVFDFVASFVLIVLLSPLFLIIALCIALDSPGPIIYKNIRVGQRGMFPTFKFRSMFAHYCTGSEYDKDGNAETVQKKLIETNSEREGPVFKVLKDPRRTRVGRILERSSLDELPQLFNVLIGSMSLVGPRPHMPQEVAGYKKQHHELFNVKPGITGLAQISGRSDLDFNDEARLDCFYIENWSFFLDCIILAKTPYAVLTRKSRV